MDSVAQSRCLAGSISLLVLNMYTAASVSVSLARMSRNHTVSQSAQMKTGHFHPKRAELGASLSLLSPRLPGRLGDGSELGVAAGRAASGRHT